MTLNFLKLIIVAWFFDNYALTIYGSVKFGAIAHVGTRKFTIIGALVAVFHSSKCLILRTFVIIYYKNIVDHWSAIA